MVVVPDQVLVDSIDIQQLVDMVVLHSVAPPHMVFLQWVDMGIRLVLL